MGSKCNYPVQTLRYPPPGFWASILAVVAVVSAVTVFVEHFMAKAQDIEMSAIQVQESQRRVDGIISNLEKNQNRLDLNQRDLEKNQNRLDLNQRDLDKKIENLAENQNDLEQGQEAIKLVQEKLVNQVAMNTKEIGALSIKVDEVSEGVDLLICNLPDLQNIKWDCKRE